MNESKLQSDIIKYLRSKDCFVMKLTVVPVIPTGTSDIFFCLEGFYGFIEVKASKKAPFRPLQEEFIAKMDEWSWARVVYSENWPEVKQELEQML